MANPADAALGSGTAGIPARSTTRSMTSHAALAQHIPALRRYAWALLRNDADADDLVQDCLLRAMDHADAIRDSANLRPLLFTIMHNLHVSRWRSLKRRANITVQDDDADAPTQAAQHASAEMHAVLRALAQLPEDQRQVLLLIGVEGFGYDEAAAILKIPVGTVMSRLSRARDRLRDSTEGRERPALRRVE